jgi:hypothetical protein
MFGENGGDACWTVVADAAVSEKSSDMLCTM